MSWSQEIGFENFLPCRQFAVQCEVEANKEIQIHDNKKSIVSYYVDACDQEEFRDQNCHVLVTNNWIDPATLDRKYYETFSDSWYGIYAGKVPIERVNPIKTYNCLINRMDPIRQSWLYQLVRRDLFDQGYVSFNMDISRHVDSGQCGPDSNPVDVFEQQFNDHLQIFEPEHRYLRTLVPYKNFDNSTTLNQLIMQSKFSIILETYFDRNTIITYSEKVFRCLKLPRPWIIFAMKGAVEYLRTLGFDVLDDLVDHSYDQIEWDIDRQIETLNQAQLLSQQNLTADMISRCEQAAAHNQQLLDKLYLGFHETVNTTYSRAVTKCLSL